MKTNRNFWRVLVLALALVMMFAIVACAKDGDEAAATTEAAGSTAGSTEAETTTAKATTEPKQTTATTEPATTEPASTEPATTEDLSVADPDMPEGGYAIKMPSQFDNDGDKKNDYFVFSNYLPVQFTSADAIKIDPSKYTADSVGVKTHTVSNIIHYYLDFYEESDGADKMAQNADMFITWEFEVAADGYYDFCFQMRMKDGSQRGNIMLIDGKEIVKMDFQFKDGAEAAVKDDAAVMNSYMSGFGAELTAGKHTLTMKGVPTLVKTFHFRGIYLVKSDVKKNAVSMPSQFDNDGDKVNDAFIFSNYLPVKFTSNDVVVIDPSKYTADSVGVKTHTVSNIIHYYLDFYEESDGADKMAQNADMFITWEFEVAADGYYDFCFQMRMKDGSQRGNIMLIDGKEIVKMDFQFKDGAEAAVKDDAAVMNSYMSGFGAELTAGKHTLTMKGVPTLVKTFHFRGIYLVKTADLPAATPAA